MEEEEKKTIDNKYESEQLDLLYTALCKAQSELEIAVHNSKNPFYRSSYSDFNGIVRASRPALTKHGLCVLQRVMTNGSGHMYLFTRLAHSSGQWIESKMPICPPKNDIQTIGSYITYLKRYNYAAIVGVVAAEEDDDGEWAMQRHETVYGKKAEIDPTITSSELDKLVKAFDGDQEKIQKTLDHYKIDKLADLPVKHLEKIMNGLKKKK